MKERERIVEFIQNELDADKYENVFVIWNAEMKGKSQERIRYNCDQIVLSYNDSEYEPQMDLKPIDK